jgi:hypothetical protein
VSRTSGHGATAPASQAAQPRRQRTWEAALFLPAPHALEQQ